MRADSLSRSLSLSSDAQLCDRSQPGRQVRRRL